MQPGVPQLICWCLDVFCTFVGLRYPVHLHLSSVHACSSAIVWSAACCWSCFVGHRCSDSSCLHILHFVLALCAGNEQREGGGGVDGGGAARRGFKGRAGVTRNGAPKVRSTLTCAPTRAHTHTHTSTHTINTHTETAITEIRRNEKKGTGLGGGETHGGCAVRRGRTAS